MVLLKAVQEALKGLGVEPVYIGFVDAKVGLPVVIVDLGRMRPNEVPGIDSGTVNVSVIGYGYDNRVDAMAELVEKLHNVRLHFDGCSAILVLNLIESYFTVSNADIVKTKRLEFTVHVIER